MFDIKEHKNLISLLRKKTSIKNEEGLNIIIKGIPDSNAQGDLDPRVLKLTLEAENNLSADDKESSIEDMRKAMGFPNLDITEIKINITLENIPGKEGSIPVKIYSPDTSKENYPAIIFFHGGGFFGGSLKTVENPCKYLAEKADAIVVSVDYRLAPEHKFPAGFNDCFDTVKWVYDNAKALKIDSSKIGVSGDSAGGNLAAVCSLKDRELGTNIIKFQALIYPVVNLSGITTEDYKWDISKYEIKNHRALITGIVNGLNDPENLVTSLYLENVSDETNQYVSPLFSDNLENLPETLIITAEYDFLRIQCEAYARKLQKAGVKMNIIRYNGMDHAFIDKLGVYPQAADCMEEIAKYFNNL